MSVLHGAGPREDQPRPVLGPVRASDGRHELVSVMQSISLADELTLAPAPRGAPADDRGLPRASRARPQENLAALALARVPRAPPAGRRRRCGCAIVKRIPVAAGLGGGSADAAARAAPGARTPRGSATRSCCASSAAELGADVPAQVVAGALARRRRRRAAAGLPAPPPRSGCSCCPAAGGLSTAAVYREADRLGPGRARARRAEPSAASS